MNYSCFIIIQYNDVQQEQGQHNEGKSEPVFGQIMTSEDSGSTDPTTDEGKTAV